MAPITGSRSHINATGSTNNKAAAWVVRFLISVAIICIIRGEVLPTNNKRNNNNNNSNDFKSHTGRGGGGGGLHALDLLPPVSSDSILPPPTTVEHNEGKEGEPGDSNPKNPNANESDQLGRSERSDAFGMDHVVVGPSSTPVGNDDYDNHRIDGGNNRPPYYTNNGHIIIGKLKTRDIIVGKHIRRLWKFVRMLATRCSQIFRQKKDKTTTTTTIKNNQGERKSNQQIVLFANDAVQNNSLDKVDTAAEELETSVSVSNDTPIKSFDKVNTVDTAAEELEASATLSNDTPSTTVSNDTPSTSVSNDTPSTTVSNDTPFTTVSNDPLSQNGFVIAMTLLSCACACFCAYMMWKCTESRGMSNDPEEEEVVAYDRRPYDEIANRLETDGYVPVAFNPSVLFDEDFRALLHYRQIPIDSQQPNSRERKPFPSKELQKLVERALSNDEKSE